MAYRFAHRVLANSPSVGETVVRDEGVNRERVVVIPNFVEEAAFTPLSADRRTVLRREVGLAPDDVAVGIIANLYPVKNHAMLMRAAGRLAAARPDVRFVLIGEGNEREALTRLRHELRLDDRVVMPGRMANEPGLAGIFDIAVLTSVEEGFPNWIVEAMAAGRAVVFGLAP
jgi:glycosyltransferase involved in cell wall biosynthesis